MNATLLRLCFCDTPSTLDGHVLIKHATLPPPEHAETLQARCDRQQDAMRCAADWLRQNALGRALEVLEANL